MMRKDKQNQIIGRVLLGICIFLAAVSVYLSFGHDIWYDELFTMGLTDRSFTDLISVAARDVHPPLYYLIIKCILDMGKMIMGNPDRVIMAKIISVLPFLLLLIYGVIKVRKHFGMLTAGIFCFLVYTMPQLSQYSVEVRMYGFSIFFITAGILHAYEITRMEEGKGRFMDFIGVTIYLLAAAYTHYFAFVAAVMVYIYLLVWLIGSKGSGKYLAAWGSSVGAAILAYLPWLSAVLRQVGSVKENYWIQPLTWRSVGGCIKFLFKPSFANDKFNSVMAVILCAVFIMAILRAVWKGLKYSREENRREQVALIFACLGILAGVVIFGFAASFLLRPIFIYRYMLPAVGVFWLAFAIALGWLIEEKKLFLVVLAIFVMVGLRNYRAFYGEEMWKRVQMQTTQEVLARIQPEDILIFNFNHTQGITAYGLPNQTFLYHDRPEELIEEMFPRIQGMGGEEEIQGWLSQGKKVWFLGSGNAREELREEWAASGIGTEEEAECLIERYWFSLYRVY